MTCGDCAFSTTAYFPSVLYFCCFVLFCFVSFSFFFFQTWTFFQVYARAYMRTGSYAPEYIPIQWIASTM